MRPGQTEDDVACRTAVSDGCLPQRVDLLSPCNVGGEWDTMRISPYV